MKIQDHPKIQQNENGDLFLNFGEYGQEVELACFSSDGTKLLTVKEVGLAEIWDLTSKSLVRQFRPTSPLEGSDKAPVSDGFKVFIESVSLNPDGTLALLGLNDGTARLFSIDTGEELSIFFEPGTNPSENWSVIRSVKFSPDGTLALIGFYGRSVGVWNVSEIKYLRTLIGLYPDRLFSEPFVRDTMVSSLSITSDNRYVFAGFADMTATVWDFETGEVVFDAHEHVEKILDVWESEGTIRWASSGGNIYEKDRVGLAQKILSTNEAWIEVAFSPKGEEFLTRSINGEVKKWAFNGEFQYLGFAGRMFPHGATLLVWSNDAKLKAYVSEDKNLIISSETNQTNCQRRHAINQISISPKNDLVASQGWSFSIAQGRKKPIELWNVSTGEMLHNLISKEDVSGITFSPCGKMIAAGALGKGGPGEIRGIYIWDTKTGEQIFELDGHIHQVHAIAFSPNSKWMVSAGLDRTVRFWNLTSDNISSPFRKNILFRTNTLSYDDLKFNYLNILSDERVVIYRESSIEVWENGRKFSIPIEFDYGMKWLVTNDENHIIGTYNNQVLLKYSLRTATEPEIIQAEILRPEFLPSNSLDFQDFEPKSGGYLWRTAFGNFSHIGDGPRGWVSPLCVSENGEFAIIPGKDKAALLKINPTQKCDLYFPFEGRMRAGCILERKIYLVNSNGRIFAGDKTTD